MYNHRELVIGTIPDPEMLSSGFCNAINDTIERRSVGRITVQWEILLLSIMLGVIFTVSIYDVYWSFKTAETLSQMEQNPIGSWLIKMDGGDISLFMTAKMVGTMLVILTIPTLYCYRKHWGLLCGGALCLFQCMLLVYFEYGHTFMMARH